MIRMIDEGGAYCPRPFCDYCGERVVRGGIVKTAGAGQFGPPDALVFLHKGECDQAYHVEGDHRRGWIELDWLPLQLLLNVHPEWQTRQELHDFVDRQLDLSAVRIRGDDERIGS